MMQIIQFVVDLHLVYFGSKTYLALVIALLTNSSAYSHFANARFNLPNIGDCAGSESAAVFGCLLLTSYLGLFINFYLQTYKKAGTKPKSLQNGNGKVYVL
jgi:fatty acid elongase 3